MAVTEQGIPCRHVIFDLDGTLVDSRPGIVAGLRHALRQLGHDLPADAALDWAIGPPLAEVLARLLAPLGDPRAEEAVEQYRRWYRTVGLFDARVYPGIPELLDRLSGAGKVLFVGTSKRTEFARAVLEHFGLARHFRAIQGAEAHGRFDRKADLLAHLLHGHGLDPAATVVVGDREHDVEAALANGLQVVAVTYGYGSRDELREAGASLLCDSTARLAGLLS
jgi:phosphoglycolate phosphatase